MKSTYKKFGLFSALFISALTVEAAYYYRGNNMLYDSQRDVTWLMDMNYAATSGYCATGVTCSGTGHGRMTWGAAHTFASSLNYNGISGWRLSSANLIGLYEWRADGTSDWGYNNTRTDLGNLFYTVLGNKGYCAPDALDANTDCPQADYGLLNLSVTDSDTGSIYSFFNFLNKPYWQDEENADDTTLAWYFNADKGYQNNELPKGGRNYVALLADGDVANVAEVPVPSAVWLFGSALFSLWFKRKVSE